MAIDRYQLVTRHNPILNHVDKASPLTVGNGEFAFTADVTGLQSLYREYAEAEFPLCTMSQWGCVGVSLRFPGKERRGSAPYGGGL